MLRTYQVYNVIVGAAGMALALQQITVSNRIAWVEAMLVAVLVAANHLFPVRVSHGAEISLAPPLLLVLAVHQNVASAMAAHLMAHVLIRAYRRRMNLGQWFNWGQHMLALAGAGLAASLLHGGRLSATASVWDIFAVIVTMHITQTAVSVLLTSGAVAVDLGGSVITAMTDLLAASLPVLIVTPVAGLIFLVSIRTFGFAGYLVIFFLMLLIHAAAWVAARWRGRHFVRRLLEQAQSDSEAGDERSRRLVHLVTLVCGELRLGEQEARDIKHAALLHDVGMPRSVQPALSLPGPLSPDARRQIERYAGVGADLVQRIPSLANVARIVRHHRDNYDGSGSPVAGAAIPLGARVLRVAIAFEAMTADRPHRRAMTPTEALDELRRGAGTTFDPLIVHALAAAVGPNGSTAELRPADPVRAGALPRRPLEELRDFLLREQPVHSRGMGERPPLSALAEFTESLNLLGSEQEIAQQVVQQIGELTGFPSTLITADEAGPTLRVAAEWGFRPPGVAANWDPSAPPEPLYSVLRGRAHRIVGPDEHGSLEGVARLSPLRDSAILVLPLAGPQRTVGIMCIAGSEAGLRKHLEFLRLVSGRAALALYTARLSTRLRRVERLAVMGELAAGAAHEIRNPLTSVRGFIQLLADRAEERDRKNLSVVLREIDRIDDIVRDLLLMARPSELKFERSNLLELVREVLMFENSVGDGVLVDLAADGSEPVARVDPSQMKQVVLNLVRNACEAMDGKGRLFIDAGVKGEEAYLRITDTGPGIPADARERIFDPFFTTKSSGTGLGLAVTFNIVQAHGGTIEVEDAPGGGASFTVRLPRAAEHLQ